MSLDVKLLPKQAQVFKPLEGVDYDIRLYQGGVGAGKTFLGSLTGLFVLSQNHGARWLVGADTYERLKISTCETYLELLDGAKVRHKHNKSDHIITIPGWGGAKVLFKGVADPQSLRSVNGIGGHLEESSMLSERSYQEFLGRLRQAKEGDPIQVILTTNPQPTKGWQYEQFVVNGGVSIEEVRGREIKISRRRVIAATLDNPYVPDAFIASLQASFDPELYKIMVLGLDGDYTRGLVSYNYSDLNLMGTDYRPDIDLYLTCDFNVDPMAWYVVHILNKHDQSRREYHFIDEIVIENTVIDECADEFCRRYKDHRGNLIITGDASGNSRNVQNNEVGGTSYTQLINRLNFNNFPGRVRLDVREKNPSIADRCAAWNSKMCNTNGVRGIFINPKCKRLIQNLENLKYQEGTGVIELPTANEIRKDPKSKFIGHSFDAASYIVEKYDPVINKATTTERSVTVPNSLNKYLRR